MAIEIERKFLVRGDTWRAQVRNVSRLRQAYISDTSRASVRVRVKDGEGAHLTVKSYLGGISRKEFEYMIPVEDAEDLLALRYGAIVAKTRYDVPFGGFSWQIDVFDDDNEGLILAEVELESEDQAFPPPEWIGEDVTRFQRYFSSELAKRPFRDWKLDR